MESMREYLLNVQVLGICLLQHDQRHKEVVEAVDQLPTHDFSSKIRRRVNSTHIAALRVNFFGFRHSRIGTKPLTSSSMSARHWNTTKNSTRKRRSRRSPT